MVQVSIIRLVNYRSWIESLGFDREHLVQSLQGEVHSLISRAFAKYGAFAYPLRYDYMIAITNGVDVDKHREIAHMLSNVLPVPVAVGVARGRNLREAERLACELCNKAGPSEVVYKSIYDEDDYIVVAHVDLINSTSMTLSSTAYVTYVTIMAILRDLDEIMRQAHGMTFYLGGDNVAAITTAEFLMLELLEEFARRHQVRIGVGVSRYARDAFRRAAAALHRLRQRNERGVEVVISDAS